MKNKTINFVAQRLLVFDAKIEWFILIPKRYT